MNKHYDFGIVGCWYWGNYGSILNGYATHYLLKSKGISALNIITPYNGFEPHAKQFFNSAYKKEDISPIMTFEELPLLNDICDSFLTGSDQIWKYDPQKADRRYDKYFRLDFVADSKKKVSFATSFGNYIFESEEDHKEFETLLRRYNAISVREKEGVEILEKLYGIYATQVMEPVLDVEKDCWLNLAQYSNYKESEPYILTYILDPTPEKRKAIEFYSKKLGMRAVNILDGFSGIYERNKKRLDLPYTLPNINCFDFLYYFSKAYFVISDSFHGLCFALVFNKPFITISNQWRGISRFETLLGKIGMKNRLVSDKDIPLDERFLYHVDFNQTNQIIAQERERSVRWLDEAVRKTNTEPVQRIKRHVNTALDSKLCTGCSACIMACPVNAIKLEEDELGNYRAIVNTEICIDCGRCKKVCGGLKLPRNLNSSNPIAYAFIAQDSNTVMESSSGGAFSVFAKQILAKNGIVIGAAWKDDLSVEHISVESVDELQKLRKSKYFQSYMGNILKKIEDTIMEGRNVLFCGTPCQVVGVKKYLGKDYDNLLLIDLLCANCPGKNFFQQYVKESYSIQDINQFEFRYKSSSDVIWNAKKVKILDKNGNGLIKSIEDDAYLQVYHTCSWILSSQCLKCKYQGNTRYGDLTIGDCWGIEKFDKTIPVSQGVSVILVNNAKGENFINNIPETDIKILKEESLDNIKKYNHIAFIENRNWERNKISSIFINEFIKDGFINAKKKAEQYILSEISPEKIINLSAEKKEDGYIEVKWEKGESAEGYIIEQYVEKQWKRIARIADKNMTSYQVANVLPNLSYEFRVKAFRFWNNLPIYSDYQYISI